MELRHLRYFIAVAEALSFTKGAQKLHLAQPSVTRQIKDLEEEIGVLLLDRTKGRVTLTPEGASFLADAKRVVEQSEEIVESVRNFSRQNLPPLNVGYVANLFYDLLPVTLAAFRRLHPTVPVHLFDMSCGEQFRALEEGRIDLGFVGLREPIEERALEFRSIAAYPTVVAVAAGNPIAKKPVLQVKELKPFFFIAMSEESYPGYRRWLTETCRHAGFSPARAAGRGDRAQSSAVCGRPTWASHFSRIRRRSYRTRGVVFRDLSDKVKTESCIAWRRRQHFSSPEGLRHDRERPRHANALSGHLAPQARER
jgi:DNA-binding transcriptional LysR family regulator